jgi:hypothetical protein
MPEVIIATDATPDPNATPQGNISGDANKVVVDPNKPAGDKPGEKLILGKYKTHAELEAAHVALEKKLGEQKPAITPEQAREAVEKSGLDMNAIAQEHITNKGVLSEKTLKTLEAKGITQETVTTFVNGLKAQSAQLRQEFAKLAGSEEALTSVLEWSATNGDPATVKTYNDAVDKGDLVVAKLALQALGASYNDAVGTDPALLNGDVSTDSGVQPYASSAQVVEAMKNPKYANDPAYRAEVERRLAKTDVFTVRSGGR